MIAKVPDGAPLSGFKRAVETGDVAVLRRLLAEHPELTEVLDEPLFAFASPALVHAAGMGNRELIDALLELGADIDGRSDWDAGPYSALHRQVDGATPDSLELAEYLLSRGATLDLHSAAGLGRRDDMRAMLEAEPDRVSEPGPDGATPLHLARDVETAALLLELGAEIDKRCVDHASTPAQWALGDRPEVTRFLLENGARPDIFMAAALDDVSLAQRILADEPDAVGVRVSMGRSHEHLGFGDKYTWSLDFAGTPLEVARRRQNTAVYQFLLERSAPPALLLQAARRGDLTEIAALIEAEPGLIASLDDDTAFGILCGTTEAARALMRAGADPNVRENDNGATPLHHAAWTDDLPLADALLEGGADPSLRDRSYDGTPLGWALHNGSTEVAERLRAG